MGEIIKLEIKKEEEVNRCCIEKDGKPWCPNLGWYLKEDCPFVNKNECDIYKEMCGKRI